jgi:hypothetical protein
MANVEAIWSKESTAALRLPSGRGRRCPEKYTKHMARLVLGSDRHNAEWAEEWAQDHTTTPPMASIEITIDGKPEKMSTSCPLCRAPGPSDTKHHLYHECPSTAELRQGLHDALCTELAPRLGIPKSKRVATHMIARPDYYTGRVGMSIKEELAKDSEGDPPKHGALSFTLLHHSLEMHNLREAAIEASAAATKDKISIYDAKKFKMAWWAAQAAERAEKKKTQVGATTPAGKKRQRTPTPPPPARTTPHYAYPLPAVPLQAIRAEPHKRLRGPDIPATPQNPTPNMPPTPPAQTLPAAQHEATPPNMPPTPPARALPATQHEATPSPPGKRALSQAKPAPPQRPPPATPLAPPASAIPIEYEATVPAHPCARPMSPDKPATNSRMTRSASKRAPDANQATVHQAASDKRPKPKQEPASPKSTLAAPRKRTPSQGNPAEPQKSAPATPPLPPAPAIPTIQYEAIPQRVMRSSKRKQEPASPESIQQHKKKARQIRNWEGKCPEPKPKTTEPEAHPSEGVG